MRRLLALVVVLGGCPKANDHKKTIEPTSKGDAQGRLLPDDDGSGALVLPPPPAIPDPPAGLPAKPHDPQLAASRALGELLFREPRLASDGKTACSTCHDPSHGHAGTGRQPTAGGQLNLRRAPSLANLEWQKEYGWDGRYPSLETLLAAHVRGQLGNELADGLARLAEQPLVRAHLARLAATDPRPPVELAQAALTLFVTTLYAGDAPWDRVERSPEAPAELKAGYQLFTGKARCAGCHPPPLYTDLGYHRLGLIATHDDGRGRVDPAQRGAFKTPGLRGAAARTSFFHDGSVTTLEAAIDWHLAGGTGQGADPSIVDPQLGKLALTPAERDQLVAFVRALTAP